MGEKGNAVEAAAAAGAAASSVLPSAVTTVVDVASGESADAVTMLSDTAQKRVAERTVDRAAERLREHKEDADPPADGDPPGA